MKTPDWKRTATLAAALFLAGCAQTTPPIDQASAESDVRPADLDNAELSAPSENMVFPWSVVPGGVRTREGAQQAVAQDAIVKDHYRAVDIAKLRPEKLSKSKSAYVSYRRGDQIYWTRQPVLLQAGETILTDGESTIRGRCGNMVSDTARQPVAPAHLEPARAEMDIAVPASRLVAAIPPALSKDPAHSSHAAMDDTPRVSTAILPSPETEGTLPGYAPHGVSGGFVPIVGSSGSSAPASLGPPPESPASPPVPVVLTPMTPPSTPPSVPLYQPPPEWPTNWYPPPQEQPLPPPPVLFPPPDHPPLPPAPFHPPANPPPSNPPPGNPPPSGPPPSGPPPSGPPPSGPPPSGPPPSDPPPHFPPPPDDPPFGPPPEDPPPPGIPEPTAFVLIGLGMIGLGLHLSRHKG